MLVLLHCVKPAVKPTPEVAAKLCRLLLSASAGLRVSARRVAASGSPHLAHLGTPVRRLPRRR